MGWKLEFEIPLDISKVEMTALRRDAMTDSLI